MRNLIEKFKKIKADTTAGPNQEIPPKKERNTAHICEIGLFMLHRIYPAQWKTNRTTLILKPRKSAEEVENWKPITIELLLGKIYSAMIDRKLRSKLNSKPRQKGMAAKTT